MTIKVLIVEPGKKPFEKMIENNLSSFQKEVGGPIESIHPINNSSVFCYGNEESKMNGSKMNWGWFIGGELVDVICGTFIVLADDGKGGERSLTDGEAAMANSFFLKNRIIMHKERPVIVENAEIFLIDSEEDLK